MTIFMRMLSWLTIGVIFLNLTNGYLLISIFSGVSFRNVSLFFLIFLILYIITNRRALRVLKRKPFLYFLFLFTVIPALSIYLAPVPMIRFAGYNLLSALIFLSSAIWIMQNGWERFSKMILISWSTSVFFVILSYFQPEFFHGVAFQQALETHKQSTASEISVAQADLGRAFGLYMQSNRAALALAFHLIILSPIFLHNKDFKRMLILGLTFFAILLTGSRGGFVYMIVVVFLIFQQEMSRGVRRSGRVVSGLTVFPNYLMLGLLFFGALSFAQYYGNEIGGSQPAVERIINTFFGANTSLGGDQSVSNRVSNQVVYIEKILSNPLFGHGLGASNYERARGSLPLSSHNAILETAYAYGIPVMLASYGLFLFLATRRRSKILRAHFRFDLSWMLTLFLVLGSLISNVIFDYRIFPVVMAFWMTLLYFPVSSYQRR